MNKVILLTVITLVITTGTVYADDDILQRWVDYANSYKAYLDQYKAWTNQIIQELRDENEDLRAENEDLRADIIRMESIQENEVEKEQIFSIVVNTDKAVYQGVDTVIISGKILEYSELVAIIVKHQEGDIVGLEQITVNSDNTFEHSFETGKGLFWKSGEYIITAAYADQYGEYYGEHTIQYHE